MAFTWLPILAEPQPRAAGSVYSLGQGAGAPLRNARRLCSNGLDFLPILVPVLPPVSPPASRSLLTPSALQPESHSSPRLTHCSQPGPKPVSPASGLRGDHDDSHVFSFLKTHPSLIYTQKNAYMLSTQLHKLHQPFNWPSRFFPSPSLFHHPQGPLGLRFQAQSSLKQRRGWGGCLCICGLPAPAGLNNTGLNCTGQLKNPLQVDPHGSNPCCLRVNSLST